MTGIGVTDMPTFADIDGQRPFSRAAEAQPDRVTMRLLVIEDDRDAADYLVKAFREVGHCGARQKRGHAAADQPVS